MSSTIPAASSRSLDTGLSASSGEEPASSRKGYLEIRLGNGPVARRLLTESSLVIGRIPNVQLLLDHHTVSRRHAEMFCDPFGRWWIRDLNSTNGTLVNDEPIAERVLQPGDQVHIGDFQLSFHLDPRPTTASRPSVLRRSVTVEEDKPTAIRTLCDFEPPRIAAEHLFTLMELSRRLIAIEDPSERLSALCQLMVREDFHGSMALALRMRDGEPTMLSGPHRPASRPSNDPPYISRRVLTMLQDTREPVLAGNLLSSGGPAAMELTISRDVMALWVVACPLHRGDDELELLYVTLPPECGSVEWLGLIALASEVYLQGESAWTARKHAQAHAAIERELDMARQIQRGLVPKKLDATGLDIMIGFEPCKWVGGDYADVVRLPDGRILLAVADVCGKGLQAALITSSVYTMVRACADSPIPVTELMDRVNKHLCDWLPEHSFVTAVVVAIDPVTGEAECVNCGHPPAIIVAKDGASRHLQSAVNPALGVAPTRMESQRTRLEPGDVLAMYTDGLTELRNAAREMLGTQQLTSGFARICLANADKKVAELGDQLNLMLEEFRGDHLPEDDRAFILARR
jgi:pSer/pThr/pTyr-binding forkhead associated (FHA) protein